jgi:hypothetical protein
MRVALITCSPFPDVVVDDEEPLRQALRAAHVEVADIAWDAEIDWSQWDVLLLRTPWDYQARPAAFLSWCERVSQETRLVHDAAIVRWNLDKRYLRELAADGVPIAPTLWVPAGPRDAGALALALTLGDGDLLAKPVVGANAFLAARFARTEDGLARLADHVAGRDFIVQPYLASVEREGELSLIWIADEGAGSFTHGVRKVPAAGDFRVQEDHGARDVPWHPDAAAVDIAASAIAAARRRFPDLVYARVDLLVMADSYVLNELELVEPALFMRHHPEVGVRLARAVLGTDLKRSS